ncbi:SdrD B-like domain-containing protein [Isoptericola croceus]|uniref:SdrD B-like domain-containing protein n=1 Tax=Isoptericola croceus TaxID=3031406 RepID=UPI0023F73162|nr:SdrD B-like domain-containing protein [Isoptericola croceus]
MVRNFSRAVAAASAGAVVMSSFVVAGVASSDVATAAVGDPISGTIWQDYDSDGVLDTFEDTGRLGGVEVRAFDDDGTVAGPVLTEPDGTYALPVTSDATRWRVEADVPDTPQWAGWEGTSFGRAGGTTNGTTVQFVDVPDGGTDGVDFSFQVPGAYVENNPLVYLPAFRYGFSDGDQGELFGGTAHLYDATSAGDQEVVPTVWDVPFQQVGATFGTAWQQAPAPGELGSLFTSAYVRRHSALGPGGIGAIYRVDPDDGTLTSESASGSLLVDLVDYVDLGSDSDPGALPGDPNGLRPAVTAENPEYDWQRDAQAWDTVGRTGLGGMEITTDQRYLFVVNLFNRSLVRVEIDRAGTSVVGVDEFELDDYFPDSSDLRPFGLSSNPLTNELYLTVTNTAESTQDSDDLHAHVYAFNPEDPTSLSEVLEFPLGYDRGAGFGGVDASYQPWSTDPASYDPYYDGDTMASSVPVVSDARYLHGNLVIGIRAFDGDLFGSFTYLSDDPSDTRTVRSRTNGGEMLLAGGNPDGTFTIEQNGVVDGDTGAGAGGGSMLNGPTGPDKYFVDQWRGGPEHLGAVLVVPSRPDGVLETGIHVANGSYQVGTRTFDQGTGAVASPRGAAIITGTNVLGVTTKGNGLGELTALASAAPIEIGNYVWYDVDNDGVQDPGEDPVGGATVNLYEVGEDGSRTWVSSTTTSAQGEYYFSSDPALNTNGYALRTQTDYVVGIDEPADYDSPDGPLYGWYPTVADTGDAGSVDPDRNDSDGLVEESDEGAFPYAAITTGGPGENDHTLDFGFSQLDYEFTKRTVSGPTENPDDDGTWEVVYELVVENPSDVPGAYLLTDDLTGYGEGIEVVDTEVLSGPDGAVLNTAWNGEGDQAVITERLPIAAGTTEDAGTAHVYTLRVAVALATDATTGEATADPAQLACTPDQAPGDPTTGLFNVATLEPTGHEDIVDDECADLPLVTLDKTVEVEPSVVDRENEPGLWEVVYGLTVTNESDVDTDYDLTDRLRFGSAVEIESVAVENSAPGGIATDEAFDGITATQVVTDEPIAGGAVHEYLVTVRYRFDLPNPPAEPNPSDCSLVEGDGEDGTGLLNGAATSFNGYPDTDSECRELGQPTHTKELVSAAPVGDGTWQVVYDVTVSSKGVGATVYDLDDTLRYTDQATIVSAAVTGAPGGVTLADPAWDGQSSTRIASNVSLLGTDDDGYADHVYRLTVVAEVPLQLEGAGSGDETDPTVCGAQDGDPLATALTNVSQLIDEAGLTEDDAACAELPSIDVAKSVSAGPAPNGDGTWTVTYDVVASNEGAADGVYEVTDRMTADGDLEIVSGAVVTAPDGVTPSGTWTGLGAEGAPENVIATDVALPADGTHTYQVEVVVTVDDEGVELVITPCSALGEGDNGGLSNAAGVEHNDLTDSAEACVAVAYIVVDKSISDGPTPNGDGTWTIVYDVVAENVGADAGDYEVTDRLHYGEGIDIASAEVVTAPDGVTPSGAWTGLGAEGAPENVVATGVTLDGGGTHTYQVEVVVQMDEATIDPAVLQCPPPGSGVSGGLANSTTLDHNGIVDADDVCASLPLIAIDKTISAGPVGNDDGTWTITYDLVATNTGQAAGDYDLTDRLRYGAGVVVESTDVITTPEGVTASPDWTGQGAGESAAENVVAAGVTLEEDATHTYQAQVVVSLDEDTVTPEALVCPEPGSGASGGLANSTALAHNGEALDDEACAPLPLIGLAKSLSGAVTPVDGQGGVYDAVYEVTVTNRGPGASAYDLDDELAPGEGVQVVGIQDVTTDAADPVGVNPGFDGLSDTLVVEDQPIAAAVGAPVVHTYTVTVRYAVDLADVELLDTDACTTAAGGTVPGALNNIASAGWNGVAASADACVRPGKPTLDKALASATPMGDGQWEVVYDLTVGNVGAEATTYDLDDELLFAPAITVASVDVAAPDGVLLNDGFDGDQDQRIATDASIAGLDDDGYAPHVFRVTVVANVPLHLDGADVGQDGTGSPACTVTAGSNMLAQGLNNVATLTDPTGGTVMDTDCAPVPSIEIVKSVVGDPVQGDDGAWTVTYEIQAVNDGAARGVYTLTDRLRFGAGIEVRDAQVTDTPRRVTASGTWTGLGAAGADANVVAGDVRLAPGRTHTYRVQVVATVDQDAADASTWACPEPGSGERGGFANTAGIGHNDLAGTAVACAAQDVVGIPGEPGYSGDSGNPGGSLALTGAMIGGILIAALLAIGLGLLALRAARRRTDG